MPEYRLSPPIEWAERSGYKIYSSDIVPPIVNRPLVGTLPNAIEKAIQIHQIQSTHSPILIEAKDVYVLQWHWTGEFANSQYTYFFLSQNGDFLISDIDLNPLWLKYFPFVKSIDQNSIVIDEDCQNNVLGNVIDNYGIFCGGNLHFGHWVSDTLYKFLLSDLFPSCGNFLICNHLTKYFQDTLAYLMSSRNRNHTTIGFLPEGTKKLTVYKFCKIYIPLQFSLPLRYQLVRQSLSNLCYPNKSLDLPGVYLERGVYGSERRILNEEYVTHLMLNQGNLIVRPHTLSFDKAHKLFNSCRYIATPFGSSAVNFAIFANQAAKLVCFIPPCYESNSPEIVYGSAYYQSLTLERTIFVDCHYDDSFHVDVLRRPFTIPEEVCSMVLERLR